MSSRTIIASWTWMFLLLLLDHVYFSNGSCHFPESWEGRWFQSGVQSNLLINRTHIETKGECQKVQGDYFLLYDKSEDCYRCMVIHEKHNSVLQYKETYCETKASLEEICDGITGDAPLYSMFRKYPEAGTIPCPFKSAPFSFIYNKGTGDCKEPLSRAESCTDDSRLVLKYQACTDVPSTESNVEELVCLATWKEGSTRYLMGRIAQGNRRNLISDEDQYRCFIYQRTTEGSKTVYNIAQSGDATCNGLQNAFEGSRTIKLTTEDNHHKRCKFPEWITEHHTWLSLDKKKIYKFSQKNATLKIVDEEMPKHSSSNNKIVHQQTVPTFAFQEFGFESQDQRRQNSEARVMCHSILQSVEQKRVQIVAHVTAGCDSGHVCMMFYKRDSGVIEIQQSDIYEENPNDACRNFDVNSVPFVTLTTTSVSTLSHAKTCPDFGRYSTLKNSDEGAVRKKRQQFSVDKTSMSIKPECLSKTYEALAVGCGHPHEMEFRSPCTEQSLSTYTCFASWQDNNTRYVIASPASRTSTEPRLYCLVYTLSGGGHAQQQSSSASLLEGALGRNSGVPVLRLSAVTESCHRHVVPGSAGLWYFNFTSNGTCAESGNTNTATIAVVPTVVIVTFWSLLAAYLLR